MKSFRFRLAVRATAMIAVGFGVLAVLAYLAVRQTLDAQINASLLNVASIQAASVTEAPSGTMRFHEWDLTPEEDVQLRALNRFAQIWTQNGRSMLRTKSITSDLPLDRHALREAASGKLSWAEQHFQGLRIRSLYYPLSRFGRAHERHVLQVAAPLGERDRMLSRLQLFLILITAVVSSAAFVGSSWLARRAVKPVNEIIQQAREIGGGTLERRISAYADNEEYRGLVEVLNTMLERLQDAFEAQRRFTADASHELRSPLTALRGELELARRRPRTGAEYERTIDSSLEEVERLSRIAEDLLTLARSDAGMLVMHPEPVDLSGVVSAVVARIAAAAEARGVRLNTHTHKNVLVSGDPDLLARLVWNLVGNAVKFTPDGGRVEIAAHRADGHAELRVADTGPGIPVDAVERIFDRFYQVNQARTIGSGQSGTGLGLAIVRAIADLHGASASASNEADGAVFIVRFPRV